MRGDSIPELAQKNCCSMYGTKWEKDGLVAQFAQKFALIHAVLEGFATINENHRNFIRELPPQLFVAVHIHILPDKSAAALQLPQRLLDDFTQMAAFA